MVFGGLAVALYAGDLPFAHVRSVFHKVDLQSMFFALIFVVVILVLAYLTNPTENSFRTYLTEQSFRQHLSRLDDPSHDEHSDSEDSGVHFNITRRLSAPKSVPSPPFHFANRAAVSLRTPKHVFYSFGIMTIAAVLPSGASNRSSNKGLLTHQQSGGFLVSESWFIGAFGKWWRGGPIQSWWIDSMANSKDTERCNSGVLDMKALDNVNLECFEGLASAPSAHLTIAARESPKSRGTERSLQRSTNNAPRSTTPPPLPKSASLPLHAPRIRSSSKSDKPHGHRQTQPQPHPPATPLPEPAKSQHQPSLHPSASAIFDNSPVITDLKRQIQTSTDAIYDVRNQLTDVRKQAADSHAAIQRDLDAQRERKRSEDTARAELKARTKTLEDSKRTAEAGRREAEKRLRAAEGARDSASRRIERLGLEIGALEARMSADTEAIAHATADATRDETALAAALAHKRREIGVAEDVVAALNARARELEERVAAEEARLGRAREQAELRKQDRAFYPLHVVHPPPTAQENADTPPVWSPILAAPPSQHADPHAQISSDRAAHIEVFPSMPTPRSPARDRGASLSEESHVPGTSPRPRHLSLGGISNFRDHSAAVVTRNEAPQVHMRPLFQDDSPLPALSSGRTQSTRFAPFAADNELDVPPFDTAVGISPRSTSLIPTSLIQSLEAGADLSQSLSAGDILHGAEGADVSRSFQSENDAVLSRDWRRMHPFPLRPVESPSPPVGTATATTASTATSTTLNTGVFSASPTALTCPPFDGVDQEDPFEIRPPPPPIRHRITSDGGASARAFLGGAARTTSEPQPLVRARTRESVESGEVEGEKTAAHRWWSLSNRDAKDNNVHGIDGHNSGNGEDHGGHLGMSNGNGSGNGNKKGLNPEAKVFQFNQIKKTFPTLPTMFGMHRFSTTHDAHALAHHPAMASSLSVPTSLLTGAGAPSSDGDSVFSTVSMRAFAPSPAEREALSRALGSSTNTSLERLPTLSDVVGAGGSLPPSPNNPHAAAAAQHSPPRVDVVAGRSLLSPGFAWLQSLPRMRKPKFSPWDDEAGEGAGR